MYSYSSYIREEIQMDERRFKMSNEEINEQFQAIVKPKKNMAKRKPKKEPAKFPELRYLWGVALLGTFVLSVLTAIIQSILESV